MSLVDPVTMSLSPSSPPPPAGKAITTRTPKAAKDTRETQPAATLSSPQAQALRLAHPALLAALFLARFGALVADPVAEMRAALPVVWAAQAAYAAVCLPPAGSSQAAAARQARRPRPGEKRRPGTGTAASSSAADGAGPSISVTTLVASVLSAISAVGLHVALVLFGAPFLTHLPHTFLCALHLALLAMFPLFYTRGVASGEWLEVLAARAPFDEAFGGAVGACVGAWAGAVPIPLDWDREWQKWPVTILCGIYAGYLVGKLVGGTVAFGKRFGGSSLS
ncbi:glycosylphosphatidylinositol anchor biosynthesis protein [Biscogniauxia mediterranea]|nr:glycosylphosphatidylinositol anchor biosynthesis protein [Biscogniauxia mediterranea]